MTIIQKYPLVETLVKLIEELLLLSTNQYIQLEDQGKIIAELRAENVRQHAIIESQAAEISYLRARIPDLENRLKLNSSKPPSTDMHKPKQTRSLREKSGMQVGGQLFHKGDTLSFSLAPDVIDSYTPECCWHCGHDFLDVAAIRYERRQVYDIPEIRMQVTEYQSEVKCCPHCQKYSKAVFPAGVTQPTQYGAHARALAVYLTPISAIAI